MLPLTPTKLGRYEIVDEIGKGAMGVVYLARDPLIGRLVALKTFRIGFSVKDRELEEFRTRFMREAQSAGILSHPNIVTIHDVVENSEEGLAFIAMEYVRGTNLKQLLQDGRPLTHQLVLDVLSQVGDALDYAHASKVIHRDVKPANILITSEGRVKITDFGIARLETSNLTMDGQMLGTPNYMAPEQIQGKKEVDSRADLFSLGVVLYEMLTRHKPFSGENLTVVSHRIVYEPFTPPREFVKELPAGVEAILDRALQKDPAKRYQRARELVEDLKRALSAGEAAAAAVEAAPGGELNETMSLSATVVLPPEVPALPTTIRGGRPGGGGGKGLGRWLVWGAAGVAAALLAWAGVLLAKQWSRPAPPAAAAAVPSSPQEDPRFGGLMREGQQKMARQEFAAAADLYRRAHRLAPDARKAEVDALRRSAELAAATKTQIASRTRVIDQKLAAAELAFEERRYTDAVALADEVLGLEATNARAADLRKRAAGRTTAKGGRPTPTPTPAVTEAETVAAVTPEPAAEDPAAGQAKESALGLDLRSAYPGEVTVMVYFDGTRKLSERVKRNRRSESPATLEKSYTVSAGAYNVQVNVAPVGLKGEGEKFQGNFPAGGRRTVVVRVSESGQVSINLL